jgi:hypothetical protein
VQQDRPTAPTLPSAELGNWASSFAAPSHIECTNRILGLESDGYPAPASQRSRFWRRAHRGSPRQGQEGSAHADAEAAAAAPPGSAVRSGTYARTRPCGGRWLRRTSRCTGEKVSERKPGMVVAVGVSCDATVRPREFRTALPAPPARDRPPKGVSPGGAGRKAHEAGDVSQPAPQLCDSTARSGL